MSLNETYNALRAFERALRHFDETLKVGQAEIRSCHDAIDSLWRDSVRHKYDCKMAEFEAGVQQYTERRSFEFERFIQIKIHQLGQYLHG